MNDDKDISFSKGGVEADDADVKAPSQKADQPGEPDLDDVGPGRIYDFTDDLDIAPAKDAESESTHVPRPPVIPAKPPVPPAPEPRSEQSKPTSPVPAPVPPMVAPRLQQQQTTAKTDLITPLPTPAAGAPFPEEKNILRNRTDAPFPQDTAPVLSSKSFPTAPVAERPVTPFQDKIKPVADAWLSKAPTPPQIKPFPGGNPAPIPAIPPAPIAPIPPAPVSVNPTPVPSPIPAKAVPLVQAKNIPPAVNYREPIDVPSTISASGTRAIPIKGFPAPVEGKIAPSNPRAKTISLETSESDDEPEDKGGLQATVGAMISKKDGSAQTTSPANPNIKNLRTYEGDVADIMSRRNVSTATIVMAEDKKEKAEEQTLLRDQPEKKPPTHIFLKLLAVLASLALIGGGAFLAYYLYMQSPLAASMQKTPVQQTAAAFPSIVPADSQVLLPIDGMSTLDIEAHIEAEASKAQQPDTIKEIVPTETVNGESVPVTGPEMLNLMGISPPDTLVRSLTDPWMLGVYADDAGTNTIFVVATTDFFQNAFAGMLSWESVMADDLKQYVYPAGIADIANAPPASTTLEVVNPVIASSSSATTTPASGIAPSNAKTAATASSTKTATTSSMATSSQGLDGSIQPYAIIRGQFSDHIIDNKDVREFRTNDGSLLFLYSFINNTDLVFTTKEDTLDAIISRLENQAFTR